MAVYLSPIGNSQSFDANGAPLVGGYWEVFLAGTTTPRTTYTSSDGLTPQPAQITLNASGRPANPIWITGGVPVKFRLSDASDVVLLTIDNVSGINDPTAVTTTDEWVVYSGTPTYISATSFSLPGDQTNTFQVGRRIKTANTAGVRYGSITASVFGSVTTITVANDSGSLDSGLSEVAYGLISITSTSLPSVSSLAASGYHKFSNGLILQWGTVTTSGSGDVGFTHPIAFTTANYGAVGSTVNGSGSGSNFASFGVKNLTQTNVGAWDSATGTRVATVVFLLVVGK